MNVGGGGRGGGGAFHPPMPPGGPGAWGGHGGHGSYAHAAHEQQQYQHQHHHQQQQYQQQQMQQQVEDDWGYEDEDGNWVSFNDGNEEVEFLKAQLPSEDDLLDGLGANSGPAYDQGGGDGGGGGDEWGYYDDKGAPTDYIVLHVKCHGQPLPGDSTTTYCFFCLWW